MRDLARNRFIHRTHPTTLGGGSVVARGGSYAFEKIRSDGGVEASLTLNTGAQTVSVTSTPLLNLWKHYALSYDGATIRPYVNEVPRRYQLYLSMTGARR